MKSEAVTKSKKKEVEKKTLEDNVTKDKNKSKNVVTHEYKQADKRLRKLIPFCNDLFYISKTDK